MKKIGFLLLLMSTVVPVAYGQSVNTAASTVHVFPQAAAGRFPDGSGYVSTIWIDNRGTNTATCTLGGPMASRFDPSIVIPFNFSDSTWSDSDGALTAGYVTLSCSQPVLASLTYFSFSPQGTTGMATVLSARAVTLAGIQTLSIGRFGVAIANTGSTTLNLTLRFNGTDGRSIQRTVSVAPHSSLQGFVDDMLDLSQMTSHGIFLVGSTNGTDRFYVMGLLYIGASFTTIIPAAGS